MENPEKIIIYLDTAVFFVLIGLFIMLLKSRIFLKNHSKSKGVWIFINRLRSMGHRYLKNKKLLGTRISFYFSYLFLSYSFYLKSANYLSCINCGEYYQFIVLTIIFIVSFSYQILVVNASFNKDKINKVQFYTLLIPVLIYFPYSFYQTIYSLFNLYKQILK